MSEATTTESGAAAEADYSSHLARAFDAFREPCAAADAFAQAIDLEHVLAEDPEQAAEIRQTARDFAQREAEGGRTLAAYRDWTFAEDGADAPRVARLDAAPAAGVAALHALLTLRLARAAGDVADAEEEGALMLQRMEDAAPDRGPAGDVAAAREVAEHLAARAGRAERFAAAVGAAVDEAAGAPEPEVLRCSVDDLLHVAAHHPSPKERNGASSILEAVARMMRRAQ